MSKKKKIIISIFSLALCIIVSFAWINELQNPKGRVMTLRLTNASAANSELEVKLSVDLNEDMTSGEAVAVFEDITRSPEVFPDPVLESYDDFAPGARKRFKVDITNKSVSSVRLRLVLSDIICEDAELQDCVIIGTNGFEGFDSNYPAPMVQTKRLSDGMSATGTFTLIDSVEIPPDKPVSIYFYVMFSASGSEKLENMSFSIGTINFLTV